MLAVAVRRDGDCLVGRRCDQPQRPRAGDLDASRSGRPERRRHQASPVSDQPAHQRAASRDVRPARWLPGISLPAIVDVPRTAQSGTFMGRQRRGSPLRYDPTGSSMNLDRVAIVNADLVAETNVRNYLQDSVVVATSPLGHVSPKNEAATSADRTRDQLDEAADLLRTHPDPGPRRTRSSTASNHHCRSSPAPPAPCPSMPGGEGGRRAPDIERLDDVRTASLRPGDQTDPPKICASRETGSAFAQAAVMKRTG